MAYPLEHLRVNDTMKHNPKYLIYLSSILSFLIFGGYVIARINGAATLCGIITLVTQTGFDIASAILAFQLSSQAEHKKKQVFRLFGISFICAALADSSYNLLMNVIGIIQLPLSLDSIFDVPFIIFLTIQLISWLKIFILENNKGITKSVALYVPFILSTTLIDNK